MSVLSGPNPIIDVNTDTVNLWYLGPFVASNGSIYLVHTLNAAAVRNTYLYKSDTGKTGVTWTLVATYNTGNFLNSIGYDPNSDTLMEIYQDTGASKVFLSLVNLVTLVQTVVDLTPATGYPASSSCVTKSDNGVVSTYIGKTTGTTVGVEYNGALGTPYTFTDPVGCLQNQIAPHFNVVPGDLDNRYIINVSSSTPRRVGVVDNTNSESGKLITSTPFLHEARSGPVACIYQGLLFVAFGSKVFRAIDASGTSFVESLDLTSADFELNLVTDGATKLYVVYQEQTVSGGTVTKDQILVRRYNGSDNWGPELLGVDFLLNPPPFVPPGDYGGGAHFKSVTLYDDGTFGAGINLNDPPPSLLCVAFYVQFNVSEVNIISFTATPSTVNPGDMVELCWNVTGVASVDIDCVGSGLNPVDCATIGPITENTTCTLTADGVEAQVTITVLGTSCLCECEPACCSSTVSRTQGLQLSHSALGVNF